MYVCICVRVIIAQHLVTGSKGKCVNPSKFEYDYECYGNKSL